MGSPVSAQDDGNSVGTDGNGNCEQPLSTTSDLGCQFLCMGEAGAIALETAAGANLACSRRLGNRKLPPKKRGFPRVSTHPAFAWFKFGDGRLSKVRSTADSPRAFADCREIFAGFLLGADAPALLRKGAL